ncbi:MAG: bacteriohemerythrin [Proteocatella sp.]
MELGKEFKTNVKIIDEQHNNLFEIIGDLKNVDNEVVQLKRVVEELFEYTKYHFSTEEAFLKKYNVSLFENQKKHHEQFKKKLDNYIESIDYAVDTNVFKDDMVTFLEKWLKNHILKEDTKLREFVK